MGKVGKAVAILAVIGVVIALIVAIMPSGEYVAEEAYDGGNVSEASYSSSDDSSYYSNDNSSSYESSYESAPQKRAYIFNSAYDVMGYLSGRSFYCSSNGVTMRIKHDGIYLNGNCCTAAVRVVDFEGTQAVITAWSPFNGVEYSFVVDSEYGTVADNKEVYCEK